MANALDNAKLDIGVVLKLLEVSFGQLRRWRDDTSVHREDGSIRLIEAQLAAIRNTKNSEMFSQAIERIPEFRFLENLRFRGDIF